MGERYQKAFVGKPFSMPAAIYNDMLDMVKWWKLQSGSAGAGTPPTSHRSQTTIMVRNDSGADAAERFSVLGIDDIVFTPTDNERGFQNDPLLSAVTPTSDHLGKFVITQTPLRSGKLCRAVSTGLTPVKVNVLSEADEWADVKDGDTTQLESGSTGGARIVWKEPGTGTKRAVVLLGTPQAKPFLCAIVDEGPNGEPDYPKDSQRYYARPITLYQPTASPEEADDAISRFFFIGDESRTITVSNLSEMRKAGDVVYYGFSGTRMLAPGQVIGVWAETDNKGVRRYVCAEHPYETAIVQVIRPGTGVFGGETGYYEAQEYSPRNQDVGARAGKINPGQPLSGSLVGTGVPAVVCNLANPSGTVGSVIKLKYPDWYIGWRLGWTDPAITTIPYRVILVKHRAVDAFNIGSMTTEQAIAKLYEVLYWTGAILEPED